ncbi:hypothetical protein ACSFE6_00095 [Pseudomonas baetica]|uniref:hypothetical protein n=1 Tax=Pseudomonas baetica TaxID=674054 RepID=UPI003EE8E08C
MAALAMFGDMSRSGQGRYTVATTGFDALYKTVLSEEELNGDKILRQLEPIIDNYKPPLPTVNLVPAMLDLSLHR